MKKRNLSANWSVQGTMKTDSSNRHMLGKEENIGLIVRIFKKEMGKRRVLMAKINSLSEKRHYEALLSSLSLISSVKKHKVF